MITDKFNYSKNVAKILGEILTPFGFKKKGTRFILNRNFLCFSINLTRSSWNSLTDRPKELSISIEVESADKKINFSFPLFKPTKESFPTFYGPFFLDKLTWTEKSRLMASFTDKQVLEIDNYLNSINWYYDSEESLISLLNEVKEQLIKVGLPTIDFAKNYDTKDLETLDLYREMKKKSNQLYLMRLDSLSRFPTD